MNITYKEVVSRLTDLKTLAHPAPSGEKCIESSAYNKLSRYNEETGCYENWGQNWDEGYDAPRTEDGGYIIADMTGAGAVVRIWSANPQQGHVKFFIDGEDEPRIDMPFYQLFGEGEFPFNLKELCYDASRGKNCFVPITYSKSCKIILYDDWGMFYQVNYIKFPSGYQVPSFKFPVSEEDKRALKEANAFFEKRDYASVKLSDCVKTITVPAGGKAVILKESMSGAVTNIKIKLNDAKSDWEALAELTLEAYWDEEEKPSIWTTLGGFFASITGLNESKSLPLGVSNGVMYSNWFMPYHSAQMIISNDGNTDYSISYEVTTEKLSSEEVSKLMRFHAKWNRAKDPAKSDRWPDAQFLETEGRGRYTGTSLHIYKEIGTGDPAYYPEWWWGEGDEKFFVDGEKFPSWFGTGSEDYFGYAWGSWNPFERPFHSQPFTNGGMFGIGNRLNNRFHLIDSVPFEKSFEACLEKYHRDHYANWVFTNFWYLESSGKDKYMPVTLAERTSYYEKPFPKPSLFYEGEEMIIIETTGMQKAETQDMTMFDGEWSNESQLIFMAGTEGEYVKLRINIPESKEYDIRVCLTKASDYGIVQHYADDELLGEPIDLYDEAVTKTSEISLGKIFFKEGLHEIKIVSTGKNSKSKGYFYGLDYMSFSTDF